MLSHLKLQDLILIEKADIEFGSGLHIFTGETGSGKSAILAAIRLIAGERADAEWIRAGATIAVVEAKFTTYSKDLLGEMAPPPPGEPITVRREIHRSGKSRSFIEESLVSAAVLREFVRPLLEMVDQGSSGEICHAETQRNILDAYAGLKIEAKTLSEAFTAWTEAKKERDEAVTLGVNRSRDLEWAQSSLQEIEEVNWQKEEEESLTSAHLVLTHTQELTEKIAAVGDGLSTIAPHSRRLSHLLDGAAALDPSLRAVADAMKTASLELIEADHFLSSYRARLEADPARLAAIESRIGAIEALKKRYGPSWEEVEARKKKLSQEIDRLESLDDLKASLSIKVEELEEKAANFAKKLSGRRQMAAKQLRQEVLKELKCLNLPHAEFEVEMAPKPLSQNGVDEIRFLFAANPGQTPLPLERATSGGELSRLLFAMKVAMAEKESVGCLIFDEIDSNVGGQTAAILGEKLKELAKKRQVICVTHFVQVARAAMHHFAVAKQEVAGRAATFIAKLGPRERDQEFARMVGE
jgi:DNA repair protein RecN (Recombination protein N)